MRNLLISVVVATLTTGCASQQKVDYPIAFATPYIALRISGYAEGVGTITATAKIEITDKETRYPLKVAVMIKRPDSLRIESIPLFGLPDLLISASEGKLRIFMPPQKCFCVGAATPHNISKFLHISLSASELVPLLLGLPPDNISNEGELTGSQDGNLYRIEQRRSDKGILSIWIDPSTNRIAKMALTKNQTRIYEAFFEKHLLAGGYHIPQNIVINGQETTTMKIRYTELQAIPADEAPETSFSLPVPDGITPTRLN